MNEEVRRYWDQGACGTYDYIVGTLPGIGVASGLRRLNDIGMPRNPSSRRLRSSRLIEEGAVRGRGWGRDGPSAMGACRRGLLWRRSDATCDRDDAGASLIHGLSSILQRIDAETLPFPDATFDVVYSWGVIHHSAHPEQIVREIRRVLKPDGLFIGMVYARNSLVALQVVDQTCAAQGSALDLVERTGGEPYGKPGTKAYTVAEVREVWSGFSSCETKQLLTCYDRSWFPGWMHRLFPRSVGWFIVVRARK